MDADATAQHLLDHRQRRAKMEDLPPDLRPTDLAEAYRVQEVLVGRLLDGSGGLAVGYKVACTNTIAQAASEDRPTLSRAAVVLDHLRFPRRAARGPVRPPGHRGGVRHPHGRHRARRQRPPHGGHDRSVRRGGAAFIEVVDHRFVDWSVGALPVAADNAIHGCWVKGEPTTRDWRNLNLADHEVTVTVDGQVATTGTGSAVLGHPLNVVAWLADELPRFGRQLLGRRLHHHRRVHRCLRGRSRADGGGRLRPAGVRDHHLAVSAGQHDATDASLRSGDDVHRGGEPPLTLHPTRRRDRWWSTRSWSGNVGASGATGPSRCRRR